MKHEAAPRKPWAVLAYTVADDKAHGAALDRAAQRELKAACDAADFTQVSLAAQVDFKKAARGVYRAAITAAPPPSRGFHDVDVDKHPRSEEHTSELQSLRHLVCRLLLEKKTKTRDYA